MLTMIEDKCYPCYLFFCVSVYLEYLIDYVYIYIYICVCEYMYMYVYMYVYVYACVYMCIHVYEK